MSMRIRVYEDGGGGVVIRLEEDDPVAIGQLVIPPEHRTAVALALLGDRDALIERMAHTLSVEFWSITPDEWDLLLPADHENLRQRARRVLAAIDGGGKGWQ